MPCLKNILGPLHEPMLWVAGPDEGFLPHQTLGEICFLGFLFATDLKYLATAFKILFRGCALPLRLLNKRPRQADLVTNFALGIGDTENTART